MSDINLEYCRKHCHHPFQLLLIASAIIFLVITTSVTVRAQDNQHKLTVVFDSIQINNKHEAEALPFSSDLLRGKGEWKMDIYVNEKRFPLSAGSGMNQVDNGNMINFVGKQTTVSVPSNNTLRLVSAGFEQDSEHIILPDISDDLKDAIPTISGIGVGGSNIAAMYDIAKKIITYDKNDALGILSREYSSDNNFGVGSHVDCSTANANITDLQRQQGTSCDFILKYRIMDENHSLPPSEWHDWQKMDGIPLILSTPAAASYIPGKFDLMALDQNGEFWLPNYDYGWKAPILIPDQTIGSQTFEPSTLQPAIFTWSPDRLYLFALSIDKSLWYNFYNLQTGRWHNWEKFGGSFISGPTVFKSSQDAIPKQINVYALKDDGYVYQRQYALATNQWSSNWEKMAFLGNEFSHPPALILPKGTRDRLDAFASLNNGSLWHGWFILEPAPAPNPNNLYKWNLKGKEVLSNFNFTSQPAVISSLFQGPLDLYVQVTDNTLEHGVYNYDSKKWTKWENMGKIYSTPIVVSPTVDRIDIFYLNNTSIMHKWHGN